MRHYKEVRLALPLEIANAIDCAVQIENMTRRPEQGPMSRELLVENAFRVLGASRVEAIVEGKDLQPCVWCHAAKGEPCKGLDDLLVHIYGLRYREPDARVVLA